MGSWLVERRLAKVASRLRSLRDELATIDEQIAHFVDDADDLAVRALVSESPAASHESDDAQKHVDAMRRHREHVLGQIADLEARQDRLLDDLTERAR
jgi:predicted  nucleic acid-binding Zn-ribbon protein